MEGAVIIFMAVTALIVLALAIAAAYESRCPECKAWFAKRTVDRRYRELLKMDVCTVRCTKCNHQWNKLRKTRRQEIPESVAWFVAEFFR